MPTIPGGDFMFGSEVATPPVAFRIARIFPGLLGADAESLEDARDDRSDRLHRGSIAPAPTTSEPK